MPLIFFAAVSIRCRHARLSLFSPFCHYLPWRFLPLPLFTAAFFRPPLLTLSPCLLLCRQMLSPRLLPCYYIDRCFLSATPYIYAADEWLSLMLFAALYIHADDVMPRAMREPRYMPHFSIAAIITPLCHWYALITPIIYAAIYISFCFDISISLMPYLLSLLSIDYAIDAISTLSFHTATSWWPLLDTLLSLTLTLIIHCHYAVYYYWCFIDAIFFAAWCYFFAIFSPFSRRHFRLRFDAYCFHFFSTLPPFSPIRLHLPLRHYVFIMITLRWCHLLILRHLAPLHYWWYMFRHLRWLRHYAIYAISDIFFHWCHFADDASDIYWHYAFSFLSMPPLIDAAIIERCICRHYALLCCFSWCCWWLFFCLALANI